MTRLQFILSLIATIPGMKWLKKNIGQTLKCGGELNDSTTPAFDVNILQDRIDHLKKYPVMKGQRGNFVWNEDKTKVDFIPDQNGDFTCYQ